MAMPAESPAVTPPAQVVGNAFVEQYYHILHQSPELVYRFYQESSVLSRPDSNGVMTSATTMKGIDEKILSFNCKDFIAEIKTADAQPSLGNGVVVLVSGYLTGKDSVRKKFVQSFFLAPQEKGYYVLNDVFRYIHDEDSVEAVSAPANANIENVQAAALTPEPEQPSHVMDHPEEVHQTTIEEDLINEPEVYDPSDHEDGSITEEEIGDLPVIVEHRENVIVSSVPSPSQVDEPKKSYASILKTMKTNPSTTPAKAPTVNVKVKRPSNNQEASGSAKPAPVTEATASSDAGADKLNLLEEGYSIYVRNLPQSTLSEQVEEVFAKFGPIKQGGVQVRSNKQGFCFGFVEFESLDSMKSAIEASPITIGTRKAVIEEKRGSARVPTAANNNGRGRYPSSRGGFRSESFRGRGNFGGGRGYGRNDFRGQGEFSSRSRGGVGRGSEDQNGTGNGPREDGQK